MNLANDFHDGVRGVDTHERLGPAEAHVLGDGLAAGGARRPRSLCDPASRAWRGSRSRSRRRSWLVPIGAARDARALALQRRAEALRGARSRRGHGVRVLRRDGDGGDRVRNAETVTAAAWWASVPMGLLAVAILVANNLRDIPTDAVAGQADARGPARRRADAGAVPRAASSLRSARSCSASLVEIAERGRGLPKWSLLALASWPLAIRPMEQVGHAPQGRELIPVLVGTAMLQVVFGVLLALGLWIAGVTAS